MSRIWGFTPAPCRIRLTARNERIHHQDAGGVYRYDVAKKGNEWIVRLPPSKDDSFAPYVLSPDEREPILPRIEKYLSRIWWFGSFPRSSCVRFVGSEQATACDRAPIRP